MHTLRRLAVLATALCALAAHAGAKIVTEVKRKGETSTVILEVEGKNARLEMAKAGSAVPEGTVISDGDGKRMLIVSHEKKEYLEMSQEQLKQLKEAMEAARTMMKLQLSKMPPEQRAKAEAMMAQQGKGPAAAAPPEEKLVRASGSKKIAGYRCDLYKVEVGGEHVADTCLIPWGDLKFDQAQVKKSMEAMQETWGMGASPKTGAPGLQSWGTGIGLPAWRKTVKAGEEEATETTLITLAEAAIPKEAFAPPAGYARKSVGEKLEKKKMEKPEK